MIKCRTSYGRRLFYPRRKTILYYVQLNPTEGPPVYKVGITSVGVNRRFMSEKIKYDILFTKQYPGGRLAYIEEQRILSEYSEYLLQGCKLLRSGNTEVFGVDIRKYSNKEIT